MKDDEEEYRIIELGDGRKIVTTDAELKRVVLALRHHVVKFSDMPRLLTEHCYLFRNCDPIWERQFKWNRNTSTSSISPITFSNTIN